MKTGKNNNYCISANFRKFFLITALFLLPFCALAEVLSGLVVSVSDGDTIKVLDDTKRVHTIRLIGVDAPEKAQPFGQTSKQSLSALIYGQQVLVEWSKRDRYGRTVGKVLTSEGMDVCLEQITQGMAWHYKKYANEQSAVDRSNYAQSELLAQELRVGLWQDSLPIPPWIWRHSKTN